MKLKIKKYGLNSLFIFSLIAFFIIVYVSMRLGPGLSPDSISYVKAAKGLAEGNGIIYFTSQWPPLYPLILSLVSTIFNAEVLQAGRIIQSILYLLNILIIYKFICKLKFVNSKLFCIGISFIICLHGTINYIHYYTWSEALFISLVMVNLLTLIRVVNHGNFNRYFFLLLILSTLALYTRYIGFTVAIVNGIIVYIFINGKKKSDNIKYSLVQIVIPIFLILPWFRYRSDFQDKNLASIIEYQGFKPDIFIDGFANIGRWFLPSNLHADYNGGSLIQVVIGIVFVVYTVLNCSTNFIKIIKDKKNDIISDEHLKVSFILGAFILIYLFSFVIFILFLTARITYENRYLSVAYFPSILFIILQVFKYKNKKIKYLVWIVIIYSFIQQIPEIKQRMLTSYFRGIEINSVTMKERKVYKYVEKCPKDARVISDHPWNYDLLFDTKVRWLPRELYFGSGKSNPNYRNELNELKNTYDIVIIENIKEEIMEILKEDNFNLIVIDDNTRIFTSKRRKINYCQ